MSKETSPNVVELSNAPPADPKVTEFEQLVQATIRRSYLNGMAVGMKTMCGSILERMNDMKNMNPQRQLSTLRQWCNQCLARAETAQPAVSQEVADEHPN